MHTQLPSAPSRVPAPFSEPPTRGAELVTRDGRSLPLVSAKLHATACGGIARVVLEQRFENRHDETLHVRYRMPLPADGAVSGYAFQIAGRTITGRIERKHAAREQFERAVASGKTAGLLEQDRADIFSQAIGNLPAHEALVAFIAVDLELRWLPEGEWELRFPTVIGPRYVGATDLPADVRATAITTASEGVAARIQIALTIGDALRAGGAPGSPSHALQVGHDGTIELRDVAGAKLDRDIVVRWPVAGPRVGLALRVAPARGANDEQFGLLTIVPPAREARHRAIARDLILLIDTSGSMSGGPLDKAKRVLAQLIESLGDADRLELIEFSDAPRRYRPEPVQATRGEKQAAIRWVRGLAAGSSTEMRAAVIEAMRALRPDAQRQVVLATDGYIGGEEQILARLYQDLPRGCRLHFVGVGSAVNRSLSTAMARAGRGAEVLCDLDEDVERAARRIIDRTRLPILTNVTLAGSALVAQAPELLPDVFEASPFVAAVQLRAGELIVRGELAREAWEQRLAVRPSPGATERIDLAVAALFGRERVADLEARGACGGPGDREARDREIEQTGLAFQIATRMTSWIAIDDARTVTGPARRELMPQALPYGTTAAAFGLRAASPFDMVTAPVAESAMVTRDSLVIERLASGGRSSSLLEKDDDMGEFDNKPTGKHDLLEEDGTVWMTGGPSGSLDEDDDELSATEQMTEGPVPGAPRQPFTRMQSASYTAPVPLRASPPAADLADRPMAASGEMSSGPRASTGRARQLTPLAEPKIEIDTSIGGEIGMVSGSIGEPAPPQLRRSEPMTSMFRETGRVPKLYASPPRWRLPLLIAILALVVAALVWWIARR